MQKYQVTYYLGIAMLTLSATSEGALLSRLNGLAYYDTELDITWLADTNLVTNNPLNIATSAYATEDGKTQQWFAQYMVGELNEHNYLGSNNWRLPQTGPINGVNYNFSGPSGVNDWGTNLTAPGTPYEGSTINEMAHLFYNTLGNTTSGLTNSGPFSNLDTNGYYITGTSFLYQGYNRHFVFSFDNGAQWHYYNNVSYEAGFVWAVHEGDVTMVPIPPSILLFMSGIPVLFSIKKKHKENA